MYYDPVTAMWRTVQPEDLVVQEGVAQREALVPMGQNNMMLSADPAIVLHQYVWGGRPGHRDELICQDGGNSYSRYYCLMDYYDPTSIVNTSGVVLERYRFSAFGNRTVMAADFSVRTNSLYAWNFGYKGQFRDEETGYYNYGYRYYSPEIGRWLSRDPIEESDGGNIYFTTGNRSLNSLDYLGLLEYYIAVIPRLINQDPLQIFPLDEKALKKLAKKALLEILQDLGKVAFSISEIIADIAKGSASGLYLATLYAVYRCKPCSCWQYLEEDIQGTGLGTSFEIYKMPDYYQKYVNDLDLVTDNALKQMASTCKNNKSICTKP